MGIRANFGDAIAVLTRAARYCEDDTGKLMRGLADEAVDEVKSLISDGFDRERDPSGKPWAHRKDKEPHSTLDKTGLMRAGWQVKRTAKNRISITNKITRAAYHQNGVRGGTMIRPKAGGVLAWQGPNGAAFSRGHKQGKIPARRMIPSGGTLGRIWSGRLKKRLAKPLYQGFKKAFTP